MLDVIATIYMTKKVADIDKADEWYEEVQLLLSGKTTCVMRLKSNPHEKKVELKNEQVTE